MKLPLIVTNHAMKRYAERIQGKDTVLDANTFIATNEEMIIQNINTMFEHSEFLYSGKIGTTNTSNVNAYLSGTWVLLTDQQNEKVITLYKIDFNVGEDFNKQFVEKIKERLLKHRQEFEEEKAEINSQKADYESIVAENQQAIAEYKNAIKQLEQLTEDYQSVMKDLNKRLVKSEIKIKKDVEDLILRREF